MDESTKSEPRPLVPPRTCGGQRATQPAKVLSSAANSVILSSLVLAFFVQCTDDKVYDGTIFIDDNGNGIRDSGERGVSNAIVFLEDDKHVIADEDGHYSIEVPADGGMLWVRGQDGLEPGPFWLDIPAEVPEVGERNMDIPVYRSTRTEEFTFAVGSDTHAGIKYMSVEDQILGLAQASGTEPKPYFITITGDITQGNKPEHFDQVFEAIDTIDVPYVPVPGNHDWYDGGAAYRSHFGPPNYSFDSGGVHFVVLEWEATPENRMSFLDRDLDLVEDDRPVFVMMHAPPRDELRLALEERDIDVLLTGHMHTNRVLQHDTFVEYTTQPMMMGGMDLTPGGFRLFKFAVDGSMSVEHRTTVNRSILRFVSPALEQVFEPCSAKLVVAVEPGSAIKGLTAMVDDVGTVALRPVGGWNWESDVLGTLCIPGSYVATADLVSGDGESTTVETVINIGNKREPAVTAEWPMFQGDAAHSGARAERLAFPLQNEWVATVGANIHGGSPVVSDGRVFVSVTDFGGGLSGGVVALDAATGETLWEHRVGFSVRNAPAVSGSMVVFVSNDGTVHGLDVVSGDSLWTYELAPHVPAVQRNIYSSPTVVDGVAYVGGRYEFAAIETTTGETLWSVEALNDFEDLSSHASAAISGDTIIIPFNRVDGLFAFDRETGNELWHNDTGIVQAAHASPVIVGDRVYVVNEMTRVTAVGLLDSDNKWGVNLEDGAFGWGFLAESTPAVQGTTLVVGTQRGGLYAVDLADRTTRWTFEADTALIRATHYHGESAAITASPVITGDYVWLPGQDGVLRTLDLETGEELWSADLGVPMASSAAVAGELLIVASYDGSVRAMRSSEEVGALPLSGGAQTQAPAMFKRTPRRK